MLFRARKRSGQAGVGAVAEPPAVEGCEELLAEVDQLARTRRERADPDTDQRLLSIRHRAGLAMVASKVQASEHPTPDFDRFEFGTGVPEIRRDELSPELLRSAILSRGCLLIRGLIDPEEAVKFRDEIERAFAARDAARSGSPATDGYFHEFATDPHYNLGAHRQMVSDPNGMWIADSPRLAADLFELVGRAGFLELARSYLGQRPAISVNKSTLRRLKADPSIDPSLSFWHQDGAFLGQVRALNLWLSLSRCGDIAPGLDLVPARIDHVVPTGTAGAAFDWSVSQAIAEQSAGDVGVIRPVFEPGDALLFDELCLHGTALSSRMTETRYAVECWFFSPSAFPAEYPPLAS